MHFFVSPLQTIEENAFLNIEIVVLANQYKLCGLFYLKKNAKYLNSRPLIKYL